MIKKLFYLSLFFVITEGIFRKWLLHSFSTQIYVLKYLIVLLLWIAFISSTNARHLKKNDYSYYLVGMLFFIYALLNYFVSYFSIKVWLVGMLAYFGFILYIFIVPIVVNDKKLLEKFIRYFLYVSYVVFVLGFIQFYLPPSHPLNTYAAEEVEFIALSGGMVRITSIFNYIAGNTTFLSFALPLVFIYSIFEPNRLKKMFLTLLFMIGLFDMFATGSRLLVFFTLFSLVLIVLFVIFNNKSKNKKKMLAYFAFLILFGVFATELGLANFDSLFSFLERVSSTTDSSSGRVVWILSSIVPAYEYAGLSGFGIGSTHQVSTALGESLLLVPNAQHFGDQPMGQMIVEIGLIGFILYYILMILIALDLVRKIFSISNKQYQTLAFTIFITLFQYFTMMNNIVFNWMGAVHFWLGIGLIVAIKRIDRQEKSISGAVHG